MRNPYFVAVSVFLLLAILFPGNKAFADDSGVEVNSVYINNGNGAHYYLDSTLNFTVCAFPYVKDKQNVYGALAGEKFQLGPNEKNLSIGEFNQANSDADWNIEVDATWKQGECADK